mmetsp:Transcript_73292/g.184657  ORF Transcript_73292/g.184657 Transcript_73292/m.184657 type:complete len:248 (+) Transcript_73292:314-1057(+)
MNLGVHVHEAKGQAAAEQEAHDVPAEEAFQAASSARIVATAPTAATLWHFLHHGAGGLPFPAAAGLLIHDVFQTRTSVAAGKPEEGDPRQDATAQEVGQAAGEVLCSTWPVDVARVGTSRVNAEIVLDRSDDRLDDTAGYELRALEADDVGNQLVLVRRIPSNDQQQHQTEEGHADPIERDEGYDGQDPPGRPLQLAKDGPVVRQPRVQNARSPPPQAERTGWDAELAQLLDVPCSFTQSNSPLVRL